jgi:hypothetical protein
MENESTKEKKMWRKPELIVLVRNKPEEAVLTSCKTDGQGGGPQDTVTTCHYTD